MNPVPVSRCTIYALSCGYLTTLTKKLKSKRRLGKAAWMIESDRNTMKSSCNKYSKKKALLDTLGYYEYSLWHLLRGRNWETVCHIDTAGKDFKAIKAELAVNNYHFMNSFILLSPKENNQFIISLSFTLTDLHFQPFVANAAITHSPLVASLSHAYTSLRLGTRVPQPCICIIMQHFMTYYYFNKHLDKSLTGFLGGLDNKRC